MLGSIMLTLYFIAVAFVFGYMIKKDFFDNDWTPAVYSILASNGIYHLCGGPALVGGDQVISLSVFAAIIVAIVIYMAIVSYYI